MSLGLIVLASGLFSFHALYAQDPPPAFTAALLMSNRQVTVRCSFQMILMA